MAKLSVANAPLTRLRKAGYPVSKVISFSPHVPVASMLSVKAVTDSVAVGRVMPLDHVY